jgi:ribosomal protein L29
MDFNKLNTKEVRALDGKKLADTVKNIRKELVGLSMDVYNAGPQAKSKARNMRKTLARLLTVGAEKSGAGAKKKK